MDLLVLVIGLSILSLALILKQSGVLVLSNFHMNWIGIIVHSIFIGGLLYLIARGISKKPEIAKEWGLVGMSCIIGWNILIAVV